MQRQVLIENKNAIACDGPKITITSNLQFNDGIIILIERVVLTVVKVFKNSCAAIVKNKINILNFLCFNLIYVATLHEASVIKNILPTLLTFH